MTVNSTTGAMNESEVSSFDNSDVYTTVTADQNFDNLEEDDSPDTLAAKSFDDEDEDFYDTEEDDGEEKLGSEELKLLNDTDGKGKEKQKVEKVDEEEEPEEEGTEEVSSEDKLPTSSDKGKNIRIKIGEEHFNLDQNAVTKVKIDGQNTEVTVQELINNYSGKTAWDKKFTEIGSEKKVIQQERQQVAAEKAEMKAVLAPVIDIIRDPLKNPNDALIHLAEKLDPTGELAYAIEKRLLETNLDALVELSNMSPDQQEAHFLKKQNERLLKSSEKRVQSDKESYESNQLRSQVDKIREAYGVSVDQYSEAFDELRSLLPDHKALTHADVVDWASLKPISPQVEEILEPYLDEINDSDYSGIVTNLSRSLRDGKLSKQQIQKIVKDEYGVPATVKELNTKLNIGKKKPVKEEVKTETFETFEDW